MTAEQYLGVISDYKFANELNPRFRRTMEDEHIALTDLEHVDGAAFFGIYDGHGGRDAVEFAKANLHNVFLDIIQKSPEGKVTDLLAEAFQVTDKNMEEAHVEYDGTTAVVLYIRKEKKDGHPIKKLYVANCGDARAILVTPTGGKRLSYDHKPNLPEEVSRIRDAGGFVVAGRVNGILSVSRALGDHAMKKFVISDAFVSETTVDPAVDTHVVLACDGVWDVLSDDDVAQIVTTNKDDCGEAAESIKKTALEKGSMDNITVGVIKLQQGDPVKV
ncbi:MAG: putative protein phosphatase [Streblomastix strix]|uniref:PPM-type phosphatase domain-containing protein n=1 Tax=Streblomastix strix TaxID=222440 RepID=A0A5J4WNA3_9EUKA|nr:MAG: putative protein phosphatase [Streblomastix strix]